ncbi:MAG: DUF4232 domain-containing protein [Acidimicrobiales bacterium]
MKRRVAAAWVGVCLGGLALAACSSGHNTVPAKTTVTTSTGPSTTTTTRSPTTSTTTVRGVSRCTSPGLTASVVGSSGAAGTIEATLALKNISHASCTLGGYPGLGLLGAGSTSLPTNVVRKGHFNFTSMAPSLVTLLAGQSAYFNIGYSDVPSGTGTSCPSSVSLLVTPPSSYSSLTIPARFAPCDNGTITVSPVFSATGPGSQTTAPPRP